MLSPHEIATLLLAAASLGPIDADALEPPELSALEQARLVHVDVDAGQAKVIVTEDGHRVLRRLGLERPVGERGDASRMARNLGDAEKHGNGRLATMPATESASASFDAPPPTGTVRELTRAAALPADASERREKQA